MREHRTVLSEVCVCPTCHGALSSPKDATVCASCGATYPIVDGAPLLVRDPARYMAQVATQYERAFALREGLMQKIELAKREPAAQFRISTFDRVLAASAKNLNFLRAQHAPLRARLGDGPIVPTPTTTDAGYAPGSFGYFRADWSGHPDAERQIEQVHGTLARQVRAHCDTSGRALVIGAGAGRYLFELAHQFPSVLGVDLSYAFVHGFHALARGALELALVELKAPRSLDEMVVDFTASMPADRSPLQRLDYVAADALALPVAAASVSTVVMTFFADVVPLPALLAEIRRVLVPGGRVLNIGPLDYHFSDVTWLLAPEEAAQVIRDAGFEFAEEAFMELAYFDQPRSYRRSYRVWSYVLRGPDAPIGQAAG